MKAPPTCFKEVIQGHFKHKKDQILETCEKWILQEKNEEKKPAAYDGLVELHNKELAVKYKTEPKKFLEDLISEVEELKIEISKLK